MNLEGNNPIIILPRRKKDLLEAYILAIPAGLVGAHHYYLRNYGRGVLYTLTLGLLGMGWLMDIFRMSILVKRANLKLEEPENIECKQKYIGDAYTFWLPFGLLGFHQYYLRRWSWGIAYSLTFGLLGIGWLVDGCRMYKLVRKYNTDMAIRLENSPNYKEKQLLDTYIIAITPAGIFGMHHFYLGRCCWGFLYLFTFGLCGLGWLSDLIRLSMIVKRTNESKRSKPDYPIKYVDEAYTLILPPLGLLGLHHYYLRRYGWGVAYTCTFGCFGVGWIFDLFRLSKLVHQVNARAKQKKSIRDLVQSYVNEHQAGPQHIVPPPTTHSCTELEAPPSYEIAMATSARQPSPLPPPRPPPPRDFHSLAMESSSELGGFNNIANEQKRMVIEAHQRAAAAEQAQPEPAENSTLGGFETIALEQKRMVEEANRSQQLV
ncbi:DgyrCDS1399 [Dimorphilus gyrociliatus]|uniref:DgyrCDS1399 n=1 Tax=Dimorphilus gyrociliatus TaxID=2664684 RepID=A0A7I8V8P9_9ANNE|nr:DgyrCDS1399 [Dimorphilus gyrociliatus]